MLLFFVFISFPLSASSGNPYRRTHVLLMVRQAIRLIVTCMCHYTFYTPVTWNYFHITRTCIGTRFRVYRAIIACVRKLANRRTDQRTVVFLCALRSYCGRVHFPSFVSWTKTSEPRNSYTRVHISEIKLNIKCYYLSILLWRWEHFYFCRIINFAFNAFFYRRNISQVFIWFTYRSKTDLKKCTIVFMAVIDVIFILFFYSTWFYFVMILEKCPIINCIDNEFTYLIFWVAGGI